MKDYEINEKTLAILPYEKNKAIVYEGKDCYILEKSVNRIMDESCRYYGSTFEGRQKGSSTLTGITYKVPIIISEEKNMIFFPTNSPRLKECGWISLNNFNRYYEKDSKIILEFMNKEVVELLLSENIIRNQILKASFLESAIRKRLKKR